MRRTFSLFTLAAVALSGCAISRESNRMNVSVTPGNQDHHYDVTFQIMTDRGDGMESTLTSPVLKVKIGEEGITEIFDKKNLNGVRCTARVTETDNGIETFVKVMTRSRGKDFTHNIQTVVLNK